MPTTFNFPLTTLNTGQQIQGGFGGATGNPFAIPDTSTSVTISIDRTAGTSSLNSLPATDVLHMAAWVSVDGGATFLNDATHGWLEFQTEGGVYLNKAGQTITTSFMTSPLPPGTGRLARGEIDAINGTISFSGSLTLNP